MDKNFKTETIRFNWKKKWVFLLFIVHIILFIALFTDSYINNNWLLDELLSWDIRSISRNCWLAWIVVLFFVFSMFACIFCYIVNNKSYIEITNTHIIVNKPIHYPISRIEKLCIFYKEIWNVVIKPIYSIDYRHSRDTLEEINWETIVCQWNFTRVFWYKVIINRNVWPWQTKTIKFYWLDDTNLFVNELVARWVYVAYNWYGAKYDAKNIKFNP